MSRRSARRYAAGRTFGELLMLRILVYGCVFVALAIMWNWDTWTWFQPAPAD